MKIKPLLNNLVVEAIEEEKETKIGLIIPDSAEKEKPEQGKVLAVGADCKVVKLGDIILFRKYDPDYVKVGDKEFIIIKEESLLAILE